MPGCHVPRRVHCVAKVIVTAFAGGRQDGSDAQFVSVSRVDVDPTCELLVAIGIYDNIGVTIPI